MTVVRIRIDSLVLPAPAHDDELVRAIARALLARGLPIGLVEPVGRRIVAEARAAVAR
ncbi:MAG TPA: hypothetical protein VIC62_17110 [Nakamurella sp.]|jgi:hypothetical protein